MSDDHVSNAHRTVPLTSSSDPLPTAAAAASTDDDHYEEAPLLSSNTIFDDDDVNTIPLSGSTVTGAVVNFTNCIVGAGAIGLGGAIADSGGLVSAVTVCAVAVLVKQSLDLTIQLGCQCSQGDSDEADECHEDVDGNNNESNAEPVHAAEGDEEDANGSTEHDLPSPAGNQSGSHGACVSYEEVGKRAFGTLGTAVVAAAKVCYSFGCLVAYTVVVRDNFGPALVNLLYGSTYDAASHNPHSVSVLLHWLLTHEVWCTWTVSTLVILPLCCLRDMTPLASASMVSIASMLAIVGIVAHLWWTHAAGDGSSSPSTNSASLGVYGGVSMSHARSFLSLSRSGSFYDHWFRIRWGGYVANIGTFVFTFVCQHTVHLAYGSLRPDLRTFANWKRVSTASLAASCTVSLTVGLLVYMTFWEQTESDIFAIYPDGMWIDVAKLLLCITMLLTFPLPFFSCRELAIVFFFPFADHRQRSIDDHIHAVAQGDLEEPLLPREEFDEQEQAGNEISGNDLSDTDFLPNEPSTLRWSESTGTDSVMDMSVLSTLAIDTMNSALIPGEERQLILFWHLVFTFKIWFVATGFAIAAPNLGDVLDLIGCVSGTLIAFILPGCFAMRLQGYSHLAALLIVVGVVVGIVGTVFSVQKFAKDAFAS